MSLTAKLLLTPVLVMQALVTRSRMPRLPEAAGPREGETGSGPLLRLLIVGDSAAAVWAWRGNTMRWPATSAARWPRSAAHACNGTCWRARV